MFHLKSYKNNILDSALVTSIDDGSGGGEEWAEGVRSGLAYRTIPKTSECFVMCSIHVNSDFRPTVINISGITSGYSSGGGTLALTFPGYTPVTTCAFKARFCAPKHFRRLQLACLG